MAGLISILAEAQFMTQNLKSLIPELFSLPPDEVASEISRDNTEKSDFFDIYIDILTSEMPYRNITLRIYARLLQNLDKDLTEAQ